MTANITIPVAHADNVLMVPNAALRFIPDQEKTDQQNHKDGQGQRGQIIWVLDANKKLESRSVEAGITNGRMTAIIGGALQEGDVVVISQNDASNLSQKAKASGQQPDRRV